MELKRQVAIGMRQADGVDFIVLPLSLMFKSVESTSGLATFISTHLS